MVLTAIALLRWRVRWYGVGGTRNWRVLIGIREILGHVLGRPTRLVPEIIVHFKNRPIVHLGHRYLETQRRRSQIQCGVLLYLEGILQPLRYEVLMFDFEVVQQGLVLRFENLCGSYDFA